MVSACEEVATSCMTKHVGSTVESRQKRIHHAMILPVFDIETMSNSAKIECRNFCRATTTGIIPTTPLTASGIGSRIFIYPLLADKSFPFCCIPCQFFVYLPANRLGAVALFILQDGQSRWDQRFCGTHLATSHFWSSEGLRQPTGVGWAEGYCSNARDSEQRCRRVSGPHHGTSRRAEGQEPALYSLTGRSNISGQPQRPPELPA